MTQPEPEFIEQANTFWVKLYAKLPQTKKEAHDNILLSSRQREIIELLTNADALPLRKIFANLKQPIKMETLRKTLHAMKAEHIIDSRGHGAGAVWYLVNKGK